MTDKDKLTAEIERRTAEVADYDFVILQLETQLKIAGTDPTISPAHKERLADLINQNKTQRAIADLSLRALVEIQAQ